MCAQNLLAHWKLNESSGTSASDSSGNGRTGTVTGTATWTSATIGNGFQFNGATKIQAAGLLGNPTNLTISAWATLTAIDSFGAEVVSLGDHVVLRLDDGGRMRALYYNGTTWTSLDFTASYVGTGWRHFAAVFDDANNVLKLYVDGVEVASGAMTSSISYPGLGSATVIGRNGNGGTSHDFTGIIDDVRVYDAALTAAQIKELYSLLLHWKLNEASGTTANDSSAYDRDGTVTGTATWIAGRRHNAFDFNGATKIEAATLVGQPTNFTLACWVRVDAADTNGSEAITIGDTVILRGHYTGLGPRASFYNGSSYVALASSTSIVGRSWRHIAVTFDDAANSMTLYVDGAVAASTTTTSSVNWAPRGSATRLGTHGNVGTDWDLDGAIDDVRIYNRALSSSEIADLYGLVGHWKLDESTGVNAADSSAKNLDGTHTNGVAVGQSGPYPGLGQYAASFDGVNDYVAGPAATNYTSFDDGFSIAGWVFLDSYVNFAPILELGSTDVAGILSFSASGQVRFTGQSSAGASNSVVTATTLPTNQWKYVVGTFDGGTLKVYIDGKLDSTTANAFVIRDPTGNISIGASIAGSDEFLDGKLHDVRLYNRALAADEVVELYGLIGHWKLTDTSGTTAVDSSGSGNNGAYANSPSLAQAGPYPGNGQYAAQFDGSNDHVAVGAIAADLSKGFAIATWARPTGAASWERFVDFGGGMDIDNIFFARNSAATDLALTIHDGSLGLGRLTATGVLEANVWHHYVATCDNSGNATIYRDGQVVASGAVGTPSNVIRTMNYLGRSNWSYDPYYLGRLHDVRLYNRPISAAEVADIYGLVGHWKFNEGASTTLADASGAGANAAFNGGSPDWISGIYGSGLDFNGTTDDAVTSSRFTPPSVGTVAYWMRANGTPSSTQRHLGLGDAWEIRHESTGLINFDLGSTTTSGFTTVATPTKSGSWYHIAAMYDAADESYAVYVNGTLDKSGVSGVALAAQGAAQLSFGTRTGTTNRFAGGMDDVRIYNRKLSPWEVYQIYGLMAWYKLDEASGTAAADSTGRGQDGVYSGSPTLNVSANGASSQGTAVAFTGANSMQATGLYDKSTSVSAAAWVRLDGADTAGAEVISLGDYFVIRLNNGGANEARAYYYNGSTWVTAVANITVLNTGWHHFAAVLDAGSTLKLYIDGVQAGSTATSGTIAYTGRGSNTRVATHGWTATNADLTGRIDDVRVFNRALKPDEVFQLYRGSRIPGIKILKWVETRS
ncbi:MAG TPA: LamG domain-containing protein [Lacipirellulaceae bacterium]|nr:LamG domain-containing protein [Lacipirellulaceae bacterium]